MGASILVSTSVIQILNIKAAPRNAVKNWAVQEFCKYTLENWNCYCEWKERMITMATKSTEADDGRESGDGPDPRVCRVFLCFFCASSTFLASRVTVSHVQPFASTHGNSALPTMVIRWSGWSWSRSSRSTRWNDFIEEVEKRTEILLVAFGLRNRDYREWGLGLV